MRITTLHAVLLIATLTTTAIAADPDAELLRRRGVEPDPAGVLAYLQRVSASDDDLADVNGLVQRLGARDFRDRQSAGRRLEGLGASALPALNAAVNDPDVQIAKSARDLLDRITKTSRVSVPSRPSGRAVNSRGWRGGCGTRASSIWPAF